MSARPALVISSGEPAGIGPDLCLQIAANDWPATLVAVGDAGLFRDRAALLGLDIKIQPVADLSDAVDHQSGTLQVLNVDLRAPVTAGQLDVRNARYVLNILDTCVDACRRGDAAAMVTGPLHKGVIIDSGVAFTGHTEYLAQHTDTPLPVMLLCSGGLRVALATTHLPLAQVSAAITEASLCATLRVLHNGLRARFAIDAPVIGVCGLNPHAGEGGHLGREEIDVIEPALARIRGENIDARGPLPADTIFTKRHLVDYDAILAMFHDQGLPVLKYAAFGHAVNVTLGLPIVRTSVDHGTALDLAASGDADDGSLRAALTLAIKMATR